MALNELKRLAPAILQADRETYITFSSFEDYEPANPACSQEQMARVLEEMYVARENEITTANALAAARDAARAAEWRFHNAMLDVKAQVIARYGANSDEVQALGLKKKSQYKKSGPRAG